MSFGASFVKYQNHLYNVSWCVFFSCFFITFLINFPYFALKETAFFCTGLLLKFSKFTNTWLLKAFWFSLPPQLKDMVQSSSWCSGAPQQLCPAGGRCGHPPATFSSAGPSAWRLGSPLLSGDGEGEAESERQRKRETREVVEQLKKKGTMVFVKVRTWTLWTGEQDVVHLYSLLRGGEVVSTGRKKKRSRLTNRSSSSAHNSLLVWQLASCCSTSCVCNRKASNMSQAA